MSAKDRPDIRNNASFPIRERAPLALAALCAIAIACDFGRSIYEIARRSRAVPAVAASAPAADPAEVPDVHAISSLFGSAPVDGAAAPAGGSAELELTGTVAMPDALRGLGIIRSHAEAEQTYRVGDSLPGGARLAEVYSSHVVIDVAGQNSTLWLPHSAFGAAVASVSAQPRGARQDELVAESPAIAKTRGAQIRHPVNVPGSRIVNALHPRAIVAEDHLLGYRFSSDGGGPAIPGLPRGALVRQIDGVPLTDGVVTARALQAMAARGTATFVIRAGDGEKSITLDVSHIAQANP